MPTYELTCEECGERFEIFVMRMLRNSDLVCPKCGSNEIRRGIGGGVVRNSSSVASSGGAGCATSSGG